MTLPSAGSGPFGDTGHTCAFFHDRDEEYRALGSFVLDGLRRGARGFRIGGPARLGDHRRRLTEGGIDVAAAEADGRLEIRDWSQAHLRGGRFDMDLMVALAAEAIQETRRRGYRRTRFVTHMEWALAVGLPADHLAEYEAKANYSVPRDGDPVICVYDLTRWGGQTLVDMVRTHHKVIIGGVLHENPFYIAPDEFLVELRTRSGARPGNGWSP